MNLSEIESCPGCGEGVMHGNRIHFYTVTVVNEIIDLQAVREGHAMDLLFPGSPSLARMFASSDQIAHPVGTPDVMRVCWDCYLSKTVSDLHSLWIERKKQTDGT